jgi:hypothetical protein
MAHPADGFRFGLEHEFAVIDDIGRFADFTNTTFEEMDRVVAELPVFDSDYPTLRVGDLGIKNKRWYIEGFERFTEDPASIYAPIPKGIEIRTPLCLARRGARDARSRPRALDGGGHALRLPSCPDLA